MNKLLIFTFIMAIVIGLASATLIDSEDFESYTSGLNITGQSADWSCFGLATAEGCVDEYGTPLTPYYAGHQVSSESGNKYLNIYNLGAFNQGVSGGAYTAIYWNHTDSQTIGTYGSTNYTTNFKLRLSVYNDDAMNNTKNWQGWAGLGEAGGSQNNYNIGSDGTCGEGDCQLRLAYWTYGQVYPPYTSSSDFRPYPVSTNCTVPDDGQWHQYSMVSYINVGSPIEVQDVWMYMDGELCYSRNSFTGDQYLNIPYYDYMIFSVGNIYALDYDDIEFYANETVIRGAIGADSEEGCADVELPYHLVENFNGYLTDCGWSAIPDNNLTGQLEIGNSDGTYTLFKDIDYDIDNSMYYDRTRYNTVTFDMTVYSDSTAYNVVSLFLYDLGFTNAWGRFYYKNDGNLYTSSDKTSTLITSSMPVDESMPHMIVVDLLQDEFDYYVNDTLVASNVGFYDSFLNVEYFNGIYFQSANSHYEIDNLKIFESDEDGNEQTNSIVNPIEVPDADRSMCDLFYKVDVPCLIDDDCVTGVCLVNGKCSHFDMTYCDENGYVRGNKCVFAGLSSCVLTSTGDMILDNFFLFMVFLVLLMVIVYFVIMMRK